MTDLNFNRMTIRDGQVYKVKRVQIGGYATDMAAKKIALSPIERSICYRSAKSYCMTIARSSMCGHWPTVYW